MTIQIAQIDPKRCSGCGRCLAACELRLLEFETRAWKKTTVVKAEEQCTGCGDCATRCPIGAIRLTDRAQEP
jgi:NAD-dependent dihydropyrimidine dehydrogenase PreA subunit